jgi:Mn-dependent DtxR family transcriptional regulator/very-short-patch-repair endonuclease
MSNKIIKDYIYKNGETINSGGLGLVVGRFKDKDYIKYYHIKCVYCNHKYTRNQTSIKDRGVRCPVCSDGVSYPTKVVANILNQLGVKYKTEKIFNWSNNKRYDFYIEDLNTIIEVHGGQHYEERFVNKNGAKRKTLKEEQMNDKLKQEMALQNGINNYIVIDARKSDIEWIKKSVLKSNLCRMYDLSKIDWDECKNSTANNLTLVISSMFVENDISISKKIAEKLGISYKTVVEHLNRGASLGWCNYDPNKVQSLNAKLKNKLKAKPIICLDNGMEFESASYCAKVSEDVFGVKMISSKISMVCNGNRKTYLGFKFKYKNESDNSRLDKFKNNELAKEVCNFRNNNPDIAIKDIAQKYNIGRDTVRSYLKKGSELGWCSYNSEEEIKVGRKNLIPNKNIKVEVFKDGISYGIFNSVSELEDKSEEIFGVKFVKGVLYRACRGERKTYKGYTFKYI